MQFLVVGCSKSLERSGMMPIIMDDQILECKEQGMQFASDNEGENNSDWLESVGQHSLLTMLVYLWYLWYALSATKKKTKNKNK